MLTLIQYPSLNGLFSGDVDCLIARIYCKLAKIQIQVDDHGAPTQSRSHQLPVLIDEDRGLTKSGLDSVISILEASSPIALNRLSPELQSTATSLLALIDGPVRTAVLYNLFMEQTNYDQVMRQVYAPQVVQTLPSFLPSILTQSMFAEDVQKRVLTMLETRLTRYHSKCEVKPSQIYADFEEALQCLTALLSGRKYLLGMPTVVDCYLFAHLAMVMELKLPQATLRPFVPKPLQDWFQQLKHEMID